MCIYDVDFFLGSSGIAPWYSDSDIGAHLEFQKPEFIMPELLLQELCVVGSRTCTSVGAARMRTSTSESQNKN